MRLWTRIAWRLVVRCCSSRGCRGALARVRRWGGGSFGARQGRAWLSLGKSSSAALLGLRFGSARGDFDLLDDGGTRFDASDDRTRVRANADHRDIDGWAIGRWRLGHRTSLTTLVNTFSRDAGAPGLLLQGALHARAATRRSLFGVRARVGCGADCGLVLTSSALSTRYRLYDPERELGLATRVENTGERATTRARASYDLTRWLTASLGTSQEASRLAVDSDGRPSSRASRWLSRPEVALRWRPGDTVDITTVGAVECHTTRGGGERESCGVLEPAARAGVAYRVLEPLTIKGNVGRYVRVPTLAELYGISAVVRGNDELRVESGITVDAGATLGARSGIASGYAQLFGFARWASDLIAYQRSALGVVRPYNSASARFLGAELAAGGALWEVLSAGAAITLLDPRDTSEGRTVTNDVLPLMSRLVAAPFFELRAPVSWRRVGVWRASLTTRLLYRASRVADPAGLIVLDDQRLLDLEAVVATLEGALVVRGRLSNLLDQRTFDLIGYPLPGRAAHGVLEVSW